MPVIPNAIKESMNEEEYIPDLYPSKSEGYWHLYVYIHPSIPYFALIST